MNTFTSYVAGLLRYGGDRSTTHVSDSNAGASHPARTASTIVEWNLPDADLVEVIVQSSISDQVLDVLFEKGASRLTIPPEFLQAGMTYKLEILSYKDNGLRRVEETRTIST